MPPRLAPLAADDAAAVPGARGSSPYRPFKDHRDVLELAAGAARVLRPYCVSMSKSRLCNRPRMRCCQSWTEILQGSPKREATGPFWETSSGHRVSLTGRSLPTADVGFYGDSFVKPFLVVRAAMLARVPVWLDQSIWKIGGRGMRKVRASARTSFYPCRTQASDTTCNIRAECAGKPLLPGKRGLKAPLTPARV
jgi:hypothetical protein